MAIQKDVINIDHLIHLIEKRPALYRKDLKENRDRDFKATLWNEVCSQVVPNWNEMNDEMKLEAGKEIQARWKNLRTCFKRELEAQKKVTSGPPLKKRRKYFYFDQLLFLLCTVKDDGTENSLHTHSYEISEEEDNAAEEVIHGGASDSNQRTSNIPSETTSYEETLLSILREKRDEIDEDKLFLMSLLPSIKRLNEDHKCELKIAILKAIRQAQVAQDSFNSSIINFTPPIHDYYNNLGNNVLPQSPSSDASSDISGCNTNHFLPIAPVECVLSNEIKHN